MYPDQKVRRPVDGTGTIDLVGMGNVVTAVVVFVVVVDARVVDLVEESREADVVPAVDTRSVVCVRDRVRVVWPAVVVLVFNVAVVALVVEAMLAVGLEIGGGSGPIWNRTRTSNEARRPVFQIFPLILDQCGYKMPLRVMIDTIALILWDFSWMTGAAPSPSAAASSAKLCKDHSLTIQRK